MKNLMKISALSAMIGASLLLQGCGGDDSNNKNSSSNVENTYSIAVTNLTNNQTLSPAAIILHSNNYSPFMSGKMASLGLELLAEGGDNSDFLTEADSNQYVMSTVSGTGKIAPGNTETIEVTSNGTAMNLSLVSMLVNTNDGFAAASSIDIGKIDLNQSMTFMARVYDAGTEANDESMSTLPGQGGEGFNVMRDDRDFIIIHPGIITMNDGLLSSDLDASHRFDNPAIKLVVTRTQ
ncbi:MAG: spondin domain-containing protein [Thiomicrorhabdus sp.]|nr:spondin domain-containing protein [Thiomicrorhabdus sp.]